MDCAKNSLAPSRRCRSANERRFGFLLGNEAPRHAVPEQVGWREGEVGCRPWKAAPTPIIQSNYAPNTAEFSLVLIRFALAGTAFEMETVTPTAIRLAAKRIYNPRLGLNDISGLVKVLRCARSQ